MPKLIEDACNPATLGDRFSEIKSMNNVLRLPNPQTGKTQSGLDANKTDLLEKKGRKYKCFGRKEDDRITVKCNPITKYFQSEEPSICKQGKRKSEKSNLDESKKLKVLTSD